MDLNAVRRYANRPWAEIEESKREHLARFFSSGGPDLRLRTAHALWLHMRSVRPDWPTQTDRDEDLAHHVAMVRTFDLARRALPDR
jgi:hypothetical protein